MSAQTAPTPTPANNMQHRGGLNWIGLDLCGVKYRAPSGDLKTHKRMKQKKKSWVSNINSYRAHGIR